MKTRMVITDLTRMYHGNVCIAGYDENHHCIRPILPKIGIPETSLRKDGKPIIYPFALVELDLLHPRPQPPHTEDYDYRAGSPTFIRQFQDRLAVLKWSLFDSVEAIFEQPVLHDPGFYVLDCQGARSLGTVRPKEIIQVKYEMDDTRAWDYRLFFIDPQEVKYRLKITDLTWQYYCGSLRGEDRDPAKIAGKLTQKLKSAQVYLRIGLARGWSKYPDRCFLQITGIYTFPDYLDGKIFFDFLPNRLR